MEKHELLEVARTQKPAFPIAQIRSEENTGCGLLGWGPSCERIQLHQKLGTFSEMTLIPNERNAADRIYCMFNVFVLLVNV